MDFKRIISALIGLPLVIIVLLIGNKYIIDIVFSAVAIISLHEYYNAFSNYKPVKWIGYLCAILICFIHFIPNQMLLKYISISIPFLIVILFVELIIKNMKINIIDIAISLFGIFYIILFTMFIPLLAGADNGKILIWYLIIVAWGTDTCAYIVGKTLKLGKHKFSKISPNKSVEGCIAGLIGAIALSVLYTFFINRFLDNICLPYAKVILVSGVLSIIGQFGDFAASSIKRFANIKDFSNLIPGHGGLLDRIDSLIFIAPFAYILLIII